MSFTRSGVRPGSRRTAFQKPADPDGSAMII
jgi:hypothetical protein